MLALRLVTRIIHQSIAMNGRDPLARLAFARFSSGPVKEAEKQGLVLKCAKGSRDLGPKESSIRRGAINKIVEVFERHGGVELDTPVFELKELLVGKYGAESKLIYDLADQGGEQLSLRYDLTVPFSRYMAANAVKKMKRYQVGKVYRRDNPVMTKGRFREFYQCDFDIAGEYDPMLPEAEVLKIVCEVLASFSLGQFVVRVNSRALLEAMTRNAGIPPEQFKTTCSTLDKLDKLPWQDVRKELV
jgi:histidyl-tRNA synthetase